MPSVCRFYLKGYCRYGRNCKFEHPGENSYPQQDAYTTNTTNSTSFSFKSALSTIAPTSTLIRSLNNSGDSKAGQGGGFSFTRALQATSTTFDANDVDMLDTIYQPEQVATFSNPTFSDPTFSDPTFSDPSSLYPTEIACFEKDRFEFRKIPVRPPPKVLC